MNPDTQNQQLDPTVVNLAKAIRQTESGGDFNATGASGEHGAYQFTPGTWSAEAPKYGITVPLSQATPDQQNAVAYNKIKEWKDAGYNVTQIASMWNAGQGEPNAYTGKFSNGHPSVGVNSHNVNYSVPKYAASVANAYLKLKGGQSVGEDPNNPSSQAGTTMGTNNPSQTPNPYGAWAPATGNEDWLSGLGKAATNIIPSAINLGGNLLNVVQHPIKTVEGLGNAAVGGLEEAQGISGNNQTQAWDNVVNSFKQRYGSLDNLKKTLINDPTGAALDLASVLDLGGTAVAKVGELGKASDIADITGSMSAAEKAASGISNADLVKDAAARGELGKTAQVGQVASNVGQTFNPINLAAKGVSAVGRGVGNVASNILGVGTGTGGEVIRQGLQAATEGGDAYKAFKTALQGNTSPEELVTSAQNALGQVIDNRNIEYGKMLDNLKGNNSTINVSPIQTELNNQLQKWNISETGNPGNPLNFSSSKIANTADQNNIESIYNDIKNWSDNSPAGIDTLKQRIADYYSPNSKFRALTQSLTGSIRNSLENVPGYTSEMKNYSDATEWINDTRKGLSLGDNAMVETAFKKLTGAFKQNNEWRAQALQQLDDITGGKLKASIAGQQLSSLLPRGLAKYGTGLEAGAGVYSAITGGAGIIPLLGSMIITSPRLVGTFLQGLGLTARGINTVMDTLNKINPARTAGLLHLIAAQKNNQ